MSAEHTVVCRVDEFGIDLQAGNRYGKSASSASVTKVACFDRNDPTTTLYRRPPRKRSLL